MDDEDIKLFLKFNDDDFTAPHQLTLYKYWTELKEGRLMPSRSDIDIFELKDYLPSIMLIDFDKSDEAFIFRLIGTACVNLYGEHTGEKMNDLKPHQKAVKRLLWCVKNRKPYYAIKNLGNINKNYVSTSFVVLPLSDDGENVNKIIVSHDFF